MAIALKTGFDGDAETDFLDAAAVAVLRLDALRLAAPMSADASANLAAAIDDLAAMNISADPLAFVAALGEAWAKLADGAEAATLFGLIEAEVATVATDASPLTAAEMAFAVGALAVAALGIDFAASNDAAAIRTRLAASAVAGVAAAYLVDVTVGEWLSALTLDAAAALSQEAASLNPLVRVETGVPLPAALVAWKLYGSLDNMGDLIARNKAGSALMMPTQLVAVAPGA
jgi:hypothetical protein